MRCPDCGHPSEDIKDGTCIHIDTNRQGLPVLCSCPGAPRTWKGLRVGAAYYPLYENPAAEMSAAVANTQARGEPAPVL